MQLGFVGLGKMGLNMVTRLQTAVTQIVAYDRDSAATARGTGSGATARSGLDTLVAALAPPRAVWVMVPAGDPTESTITALATCCRPATSSSTAATRIPRRPADAPRRLARKETSLRGCRHERRRVGLTEGYCLMVGGEEDVCGHLEPIFLTLAPEDGYLRVGGHGAGHYVKMIHNGIEYGLMQAYAEGFELMHESSYRVRRRRHRLALAARQRRPIVAARADRPRARRESRARGDRRVRGRLRRGPLDAA